MVTKEDLVRKKYNQIKHLMRTKGKSDAEIWKLAEDKVLMDEFKGKTNLVVKRRSSERVEDLRKRYMEDYQIESISELNALSQLIMLEILQERYHEKLDEGMSGDLKVGAELLNDMHKNLTAINNLKNQLGLKRNETKGALDNWELLKKKARSWYNENKLDRAMRCPFCEKMFLMKFKVNDYEAIAHPHFSGKVLCNKHLIKLYKEKRINKEDVAEILGCSSDYIDWLIKNYYDKQGE